MIAPFTTCCEKGETPARLSTFAMMASTMAPPMVPSTVPSPPNSEVPRGELDRHIGYDIGILSVTEQLADFLGAPLVFQRYSRLVVECNRRLTAPDSIALVSDGTAVPDNAGLAREASRAIAALPADMGSLKLQLAYAGKEVTIVRLPEAAAKLLLQLLTELGNGRAVSVAPTDVEITPQQAADLLNVSRPYLVGLVEKGELPVRKVGNQRRLPLADVLEYKARTRANRLEALRELTALDQELGLR